MRITAGMRLQYIIIGLLTSLVLWAFINRFLVEIHFIIFIIIELLIGFTNVFRSLMKTFIYPTSISDVPENQ